jgi:thiol-disulfide isomerase/thioredoxin
VPQNRPVTPRRSAILAVVVVVLAIVAALVATGKAHDSSGAESVLGTGGRVGAADVRPAPGYGPLPDLSLAAGWDNTRPLTDASLRGKVVLVDVWDASCINCRRTFDFLRRLQTTYGPQGLVILGVHSPEFAFEKPHAYVARQVTELNVTWPVAEDPNLKLWDALHNEYWPTNYLADRQGRIRYEHVGEGDETQIEGAVRALLAEGGSAGSSVVGTVTGSQQAPTGADGVTPETYLGTERGSTVGTTVLLSSGVTRAAQYAAVPTDGTVTLSFTAKDVYVVLDPGGATPRTVVATLGGRPIPADRRGPDVSPSGAVTVAHQDLFHVITGPTVTSGTLVLTVTGGPVDAYSFTFGA